VSRDLLYYFADGNQQRGPFTLAQLREHPLKPDTLVWRDGLPAWTALANVPELWAVFAERVVDAPPPVELQAAPIPMAEPAPMLDYSNPAGGPPASGLAITSLVLGIISFPMWCMPMFGVFLATPSAIAAIVCGVVARSHVRKHGAGGDGIALAGLILGIVNVLIIFIVIAMVIIAMIALERSAPSAAPAPTTLVE